MQPVRERNTVFASIVALALLAAGSASAATIEVGPDGDVTTIAEAAQLASDGDTVEVQAGEYRRDVAVWRQKKLVIRAVGGRAVLIADGKHAEGKGIWVIRNGEFVVEGFDFVGARVPDGNGAGIRFERGSLIVRDSRFIDNQMGLLTGNDRSAVLRVEGCEFSGPTDGSRWYHNLYVGLIDGLVVTGTWSHSARKGHLLKSRARTNEILYNRLSDGDGTASYELEFPSGGQARVVGNLIEQSAGSANRVIVSYGAEGYRWPVNRLRMAHNTVVNGHPNRAIFVRAAPGDARAELLNNVWVGRGIVDLPVPFRDVGNAAVPSGTLRDASSGSAKVGAPTFAHASAPVPAELRAPGHASAAVPAELRALGHWSAAVPAELRALGHASAAVPGELRPRAQYRHERRTEPLERAPLLPGAFQP